jgi:hypothetical protein
MSENAKAKAKNPNDKVQWTFMGSDPVVVSLLPLSLRVKFPCVLSHLSGLDLQLSRAMRPLIDKGASFDGISAMLRELHSLTYFDELLHQQSDKLETRGKIREEVVPYILDTSPILSDFWDKAKYNGSIPTAWYLSDCYKTFHWSIRPYLDRIVKYVVNCEFLSIDASYKSMKKLTRVCGKAVCEVIQSIVGSDGLIRTQIATVTDGHQQLEASLQAINKTTEILGRTATRLIWTDNPTRDINFLLEAFPSLQREQKRVDEEAVEENAAFAPSSQSTTIGAVGAAVSASATSVTPVIGPGMSKLAADQFQVVPSRSIPMKVDALMQTLGEGPHMFSLDAEWDTHPNKSKKGRVALIQIGYKDNSDAGSVTKAMLFHIKKHWCHIPPKLKTFLKNPMHTFVGVNITHDIHWLHKDFGVDPQKVNVQGRLAKRRDVFQSASVSLERLSNRLLGIKLNKSNEGPRCSIWTAGFLTELQQQYAAMDAIVSLDVYHKLMEKEDLTDRLEAGDVRPGMIVDLVPPHMPSNKDEILGGYGYGHDLMTRAAIATVLDPTF